VSTFDKEVFCRQQHRLMQLTAVVRGMCGARVSFVFLGNRIFCDLRFSQL
jgi:hypothetical protein